MATKPEKKMLSVYYVPGILELKIITIFRRHFVITILNSENTFMHWQGERKLSHISLRFKDYTGKAKRGERQNESCYF